MRLPFCQRTPPVGGVAPAPSEPVGPDSPFISTSDYAGTLEVTPEYRRVIRPVGDLYKNPGVRHRFGVTLATPGVVRVKLFYTGQALRPDAYNGRGAVLVNGAIATIYNGVPGWNGGAHPVGTVVVDVPLPAGASLVELLMPYGAAVRLTGILVPSTAELHAAPARPASVIAFWGDSITKSYSADDPTRTWPYLVAAALGCQQVNLATGGGGLEPAHGSAHGAVGAARNTALIFFNDYYVQRPPSQCQAAAEEYIFNFRTAIGETANPNAPLDWITPLSSTYITPVGSSYPLEDYRVAARAAVAASGDPYVRLREGLSPGMPLAPGDFPDYIHPGNGGQMKLANVVGGWLA